MAAGTSPYTTMKALSRGVYIAEWTLTASVIGVEMNAPDYVDKTYEVHGLATTNTSHVVIEGSNDAPSGIFQTAHDIDGTLLSFASNSLGAIKENMLYLRPRASTVTTGASITVRMVGTANN